MLKYALVAGLLVAVFLAGQRAVKAEWQAERDALAYQLRATIRAQAQTVEDAKGEIAKLETDYDTVVAELRSGKRRLRQCSRAAAVQAPPGAGTAPAAPDTGFTIADAEAALRIAADGDRAIVERNACVKLLSGYAYGDDLHYPTPR